MEAHVEAPQLERRAVGLPTAISTVFGLIVATTVLVSVGQGFSASWIFLVALGIGLLAMYMQALSFSELATLMPKAGSMNEYVRAGLGAFAGSLTALVGYLAIMVFPTAAESLFPAIIITDFLGAAGDPKLWVAIIVVAVAVLNVVGVRPFAAVEIALTGIMAVSLLAFGIIGLLGIGSNDPIGPALPSIGWDWSILTGLLGLAVFTFVGLEYTCPLAEELEDHNWDVDTLVQWIEAVGAEHSTLGSDLGQMSNPLPTDSFRKIAGRLLDRGMPDGDVRRMVCENPRRLLDT